MKKTFLLVLISIVSNVSAWARPNIPVPQPESWIKLTCFGVVSPRFASPTVEKQIMIGHIKINGALPYPRMDDLRDSHSGFFRNLTKSCTERRWAMVQYGDFSGLWLDWGTDWGYSRLEVGETYIPAANAGSCRAVGNPCEQNVQCCGSNMRIASCNVSMNTCESNIAVASPDDIIKSTN